MNFDLVRSFELLLRNIVINLIVKHIKQFEFLKINFFRFFPTLTLKDLPIGMPNFKYLSKREVTYNNFDDKSVTKLQTLKLRKLCRYVHNLNYKES